MSLVNFYNFTPQKKKLKKKKSLYLPSADELSQVGFCFLQRIVVLFLKLCCLNKSSNNILALCIWKYSNQLLHTHIYIYI